MAAPKILCDTAGMDRRTWLAARAHGPDGSIPIAIGGSDVAAIFGISPWKTPLDLWLEKSGKLMPDESENMWQKEMGHLLEVQDVIIEALAKVKELFGEKSVICSSYKMAYISVLMERRENEKAYEEIQKLIPIVRECEGEVCAKEIEMMQIRVLAQMGREEEALELGEKMRPFIRQVGGDEWGLMKALDRTINNVKTGVYRPKT